MSRSTKPRPRPVFRPHLECLEGRTVLSFGVGGVAVSDLGGDDRAWAGALQPDGKILAAGYTINGSTGQDFGLTRWNADGSLDTGFGQGGKVITGMSSPSFGGDRIWGVSLQADGKIIASGSALAGRSEEGVALARYHPNGTLDTSFGSNGKVVTKGASGRDNVLQPDGKILVIGTSGNFALFRYNANANGTLDNSFGNKGKVFTDFGGNDWAETVALQADGKIVVAGRRLAGDQDLVLARYNANGSLDTTFGVGGKVVTDLGPGHDNAHALALQPDGKAVVVGRVDGETAQSQFAVLRYNTNGSLDATFDGDGIATIDFSTNADEGYAVALQADGKIVVGGYADNEYFALARLNTDGSLDATFGTGGKVTTDTAPGNDALTMLFVQPADQKIVGVGIAQDAGYNFAAVRYNPDGSLDDGAALPALGTPQPPAPVSRLAEFHDAWWLGALIDLTEKRDPSDPRL